MHVRLCYPVATKRAHRTSDFRCCKFRPRREIIEQMTRESKEQAIREAESIFASDSATRE